MGSNKSEVLLYKGFRAFTDILFCASNISYNRAIQKCGSYFFEEGDDGLNGRANNGQAASLDCV